MKKLLFLFGALIMSTMMWAGEKITTVAGITSGNKYYVGATTGGTDYYFYVDGSSKTASTKGTAKEDVADAVALTFTAVTDGWTIQFENDLYLGLKNGKDNGAVQVVEDAVVWTIEEDADKGLLKLHPNDYYLQKNNSGTQFGSYKATQTNVWLESAGAAPTPAILEGIVIKGEASKLEYKEGESFDPAGLEVWGIYTKTVKGDSTSQIKSGFEWSFDPGVFALGDESVDVLAQYKDFTSEVFTVNNIVVKEFVKTYANTYTSDVELSTEGGTSATAAKVIIDGTEYEAIKAGTGSAAGACVVTIPANTKTLHFHAAGWNGETVVLNETFELVADAGISNNSPFTLSNDPETQDYFTLDPKGVATITFTATAGKRFVIFGVNAEIGDTPTPTTTKTIYCKMEQGWWKDANAAVAAYCWLDDKTEKAKWPGERMTYVADDIWSFDVDAKAYPNIIFVRVNGSGTIENWGAQTKDLEIPTDDNNLFTITTSSECWAGNDCTCDGTWSKYVPAAPKFYVTGNEALVGKDKAWKADAFEMKDGSYTFKALGKGNYELRVTNGTWDKSWGYADLSKTVAIEGLYKGKNDDGSENDNIGFTVYKPNDVTITLTEGHIVTVTGDFKAPVITYKDTVYYVAGNFTNWAAEMKALPYEVEFPADSALEFKQIMLRTILSDGDSIGKDTTWYGQENKGYYMTRDNSAWTLNGEYNVLAVTDIAGKYVFSMDEKGHFVITWPKEPVITYKDSVYYVAGNFTNWAEDMKALPYEVELPADSVLEFKQIMLRTILSDGDSIGKDTTWYGQANEGVFMNRENSAWTLDGGYNVLAKTDIKGKYVFSMDEKGHFVITWPKEPVITYKDTAYYVAGNFTNWAAEMKALPYEVELPADSTIEFKQVMLRTILSDGDSIGKDTTWYGQENKGYYMTRDNSAWTLNGEYNVLATTDIAGKYVFSRNDKGEFVITWPEIPVKYYAKNNWNGAAAGDWSWLEMSATDRENIYMLDSVVFGGTGVNINTKEDDTDALWFAADAIVVLDNLIGLPGIIPPTPKPKTGDTVLWAPAHSGIVLEAPQLLAGDTIKLFFNAADSTLKAAIVGRPEPAARKEFVFVAGEAAEANPAMFAITWGKDGSNETVKMTQKGEEALYTANILETVDSVVLVRCATGATEIIWDGEGKNVWNQTANYELCDTMYFGEWTEEGLFTLTCEAPKPVETKYYAKNNWNGAAAEDWSWLEMSATDQENIYMLDSVVFGGTGVNINTKEDDTDALWFAADAIVVLDNLVGLPGLIPPDPTYDPTHPTPFPKDSMPRYAPAHSGIVLEAPQLQSGDTIKLFFNAADSTLKAFIIGRPEPAARKEFVFVAGEAADSDPAMFAITWGKDGSNETVKMEKQKEALYAADILATVDSVVLVRCATGATEIIWDGEGKNVWNQTANYELCDTMYFGEWTEEGLFTLTCEAPKPVETKYYAKNNWNGAAAGDWSWLEMSATDRENIYMLDSVVFGGTGVNINTKEDDTDALWFAADAITVLDGLDGLPGPIPPEPRKRDTIPYAPARMVAPLEAPTLLAEDTLDGMNEHGLVLVGAPTLLAGDTIKLFFNAADSTLSAAIVGRPEQPEPAKTFDLTIVQDTLWTKDGGKVAAWIWGEELAGEWTAWATNVNDTLTLKVNEKADSIILVRNAPEATEPTWDAWNRIDAGEIEDCHLLIITNWNEGVWCERPEPCEGQFGILVNETYIPAALNEAREDVVEYMLLDVALNAGDLVQIYDKCNEAAWIIKEYMEDSYQFHVTPEDKYIIQDGEADVYDFYFQLNPDKLFVQKGKSPTSMNEIESNATIQKIVRDGHLYIMVNEQVYNVQGIRVQ